MSKFKAGRRHGPTDDYDVDDPHGRRLTSLVHRSHETTHERPTKAVGGRPRGSSIEENEGWVVETNDGPLWFKDRSHAELGAAHYGGFVRPGFRRNPISEIPSGEYGEEYFARRIGDATVFIRPVPGRNYVYEGSILLPDGSSWKFDELGAPPFERGRRSEDDEDLIDEMAASAVSFGSYYTSYNRGDDVPDWAPEADLADAISEAVNWAQDDQGTYEVKRMNPRGLTAKGERMYGHIKASYAGDPRAKEIAARTVYARAGEGVSGLRGNPDPDYKWFVANQRWVYSGWEYKSDAQDDLRDNGDYYRSLTNDPPHVVSRTTLKRIGTDPDDDTQWFRSGR